MPRPADPTTKIALLRSAEAAFTAHGLDGAKVDDIARGAGVSKGAFYLHFASKEEAFLHVVESFLAACARSFDVPEIPAEARVSEVALLTYWQARDVETFEFLWSNRAILALLPSCQGAHHYLLEAYRRQAYAAVVRWVDDAKRWGIFLASVDGPVASTLLFGAYNELAFRLATRKEKPPIPHWVRETQRTFARAFGVPAVIAALDEFPSLAGCEEARTPAPAKLRRGASSPDSISSLSRTARTKKARKG